MNRNPQLPYPTENGVQTQIQEQDIGVPSHAPPANPYDASYAQQPEGGNNVKTNKYEPMRPNDASFTGTQESSEGEGKKIPLLGTKLSKKWQRRLYWIVPLAIVAIVFAVLFEVYKSDFERWVKPLTDWLRERESWSWILPTAILFILSFPPLFGHEIVQLVVGLTYPLGVGIGIACLGAILGEAACFIVFKYGFTWWVDKKIEQKIKWAATARVAQEAGFRGVLIIRYSIVPPHLANPLFSCTGMTFWLYMITVILSLPKTLVFVVLGSPGNDKSTAAKWGKVVAIGVVVIITLFASWWIRKKMTVAIKEIEAERAASQSPYDEELGMLGTQVHQTTTQDTSYHGANAGYQGMGSGNTRYQSSGTVGYQNESYPAQQPYSFDGAPGRAM